MRLTADITKVEFVGTAIISADMTFLTSQAGSLDMSDAPIRQPVAKDLSLTLAASTQASSRLVFSMRDKRSQQTEDLLIYSDTGLALALGDSSPDSGRGSVTRDSDTQVSCFVYADILEKITPGEYFYDLTEITTDSPPQTILRAAGSLVFTRTAGDVLAPTS